MKRKRDSQEEESGAAVSGAKPEIKEKRKEKKSESVSENATEMVNDPVAAGEKEVHADRSSTANDLVESRSGDLKKPRENDPHRLWKRDRVRSEYTQLQDEAGGGKAKGNGAAELSLEYLRQWKSDRKSWSFRKVRQVWLLQHLYDKQKIGKSDFKILLSYLDGLKGAARGTTVEQARKIVEGEEDADADQEQAVAGKETKTEDGAGVKDASPSAAGEGDADEGGEDDDGVDAEEARVLAEAERLKRDAERAKQRRIREKRATQVLRELS